MVQWSSMQAGSSPPSHPAIFVGFTFTPLTLIDFACFFYNRLLEIAFALQKNCVHPEASLCPRNGAISAANHNFWPKEDDRKIKKI